MDVPFAAYQGERGAFSEKAIHLHFRDGEVQALPCEQFRMFSKLFKLERQATGDPHRELTCRVNP